MSKIELEPRIEDIFTELKTRIKGYEIALKFYADKHHIKEIALPGNVTNCEIEDGTVARLALRGKNE
jgi:hypothetical protein